MSTTYFWIHEKGIRITISCELPTRGIFDGAMGVYLNRFLNIPPASIPNPDSNFKHVTVSNIEEQDVIEAVYTTQ